MTDPAGNVSGAAKIISDISVVPASATADHILKITDTASESSNPFSKMSESSSLLQHSSLALSELNPASTPDGVGVSNREATRVFKLEATDTASVPDAGSRLHLPDLPTEPIFKTQESMGRTANSETSDQDANPPPKLSDLRLKINLTDSGVKISQPGSNPVETTTTAQTSADSVGLEATDPIKQIHCLKTSLLKPSDQEDTNPILKLKLGLSESVLKLTSQDLNSAVGLPKLSETLATVSNPMAKLTDSTLQLGEQVPLKLLDNIELQDTSSAMSAVMSVSTDESGKTDECAEFARPAQVASRDALDLEDTTTMLAGPESKDTTSIVSSSPFPLSMEEDSVGSMIVNKLTKQADSAMEVTMEDDSRSSFDSFKTPLSRELTSSEVPPEDDSQSSFASQRSAKQRWDAVDERSAVFPAENLFEYQWPPTKLGEYYMLQEQISEYLGVKSFKRKHRDLLRRPADKDEKQFLRERGVVTETQCDLGLTALRSDEVLELMMRDYPEKYAEYDRVLQEKEKQNISEKHKLYSTSQPHVEKSKMAEFVTKAITATAEWNMHFNRERKEERRACFDLQTFTLQYPTGKKAKLDKEATAVGHYPVALVPGQYQDHYRKYTSAELKYYPLNTVLYGPRTILSQDMSQLISDGSQSDSEESSSSDGSSSGSSQGSHDGSGDSSSAESATKLPDEAKPADEKFKQKGAKTTTDFKAVRVKVEQKNPRGKTKDSSCRVCKGKERNKRGNPEEMVGCAECKKKGHPTCLDLTTEMVAVIKSYPWQCMDCKTCMHCMDPYDEDKMMFCDKCDRGYHTFCIGLRNLPSGRWICAMCGECGSCGAKKPSSADPKQQWHHECCCIRKGPERQNMQRGVLQVVRGQELASNRGDDKRSTISDGEENNFLGWDDDLNSVYKSSNNSDKDENDFLGWDDDLKSIYEEAI